MAMALLYYTLGLSAIASVRIIVPVFYSLKDTLTPVKRAAASVGINILCSLLLMKPLQHGGLALATTISAFFNLSADLAVTQTIWQNELAQYFDCHRKSVWHLRSWDSAVRLLQPLQFNAPGF